MSGKLFHILHYKTAAFLPCCATNTTTELYPRTCRSALKRTEYKFVTINNIKSNPEKFLWEDYFHNCRTIRQHADWIVISISEDFYLRKKFTVS